MEILQSLLTDIWGLMAEMAPYLLLGFLLAGLMHEFIPRRLYAEYLSPNNLRSVLLAALFGIPLPLCSCGVLPTAMGLRREGASRGATVSFLIATPQTGVDSIIATYSLMGLPFAILRPIVALLTSVFGGVLVNYRSAMPLDKIKRSTHRGASLAKDINHNDNPNKPSFLQRLWGAIQYGFIDMMGDIGKWLIVGLVVAGMITTLVPDQWFAIFKDNSLLSILLVLAISVPMYICATGSIPIAVALMMKGLTPGAALVLLMAGPACNVASLLVIRKVLGRRTQLLYLLAIISGAVLFGLGIDYLLPREWFTSELIMQGGCCAEDTFSKFHNICATFLCFLLMVAVARHHEEEEESCEVAINNSVKLHIEGMRCSHCATNVERAIRSVEGVEDVSVSLDEGSAKITGDFDVEAARQAIESLGYEVLGL